MKFKIFSLALAIFLICFGLFDLQNGNTFLVGTYTISILIILFSLLCCVVFKLVPFLRKYIDYVVLVFFGFLVEFIAVDRVAAYQSQKSINIGNNINSAIRISFEENGEYYDSLEQYVPKYIDQIPRTKLGFTGTKFAYRTNNHSKNYTLYFESRYGDIYKYRSQSNDWILTD